MEEIVLDDTEQCQQNTHFIRNLLDDSITNAPGNLGKSSDATKIPTIVQQFTPDDTLIPIPNDIFTPLTEDQRTALSL